MFSLSEHIKETIDRVDGYLTGTLIVDLEANTVELEVTNQDKTSYIPLTDSDDIQVRNGNEYITVTIEQALSTKEKYMGCSLFAGMYARVKKGS
ncbi:hypothetical protein [Metabacillus sp. B2-18]|uniref:hypothetical protein n=1 Tax=Metabacillus sp. B2-18 TaxID=2897333 RepID=UPI001E3CFD71|nr:hypothetical protein [Metabacillus sp. B2-18]UGB31668.1 hypothetical protein LPC09_04090 [Metabacillus sp. B2-18]